jgi:hypothetical protein
LLKSRCFSLTVASCRSLSFPKNLGKYWGNLGKIWGKIHEIL